MWKSKKFKIIASILIVTTIGLILSDADIRESIKKFLRINQYTNMVNSEGYEVSELGNLQNNLITVKESLREAIEDKDIEECKAELESIIKYIDNSSKEISKEFKEAEKVVEKVGYKEAENRLKEVKDSYNNIKEKKSEVQEAIASNDIEKYSNLLKDENLFGIEEESSIPLGDTLPTSDNTKKAEEVLYGNEEKSEVLSYPKDSWEGNEKKYLEETIDTKWEKAIKDKAKELGDNPLDIYNYVRNNISYEPYSGSRKGAIGTLQEVSGNDYDESSLLIALLRYNNIPARYVKGIIELTADKAMAWTGTDNIEAAVNTLASCGNKTVSIVSGGEIVAVQVEHVWVEAYCNTNEYRGAGEAGSKKEWIPFDPSYKECVEEKGMDLVKYSGVTSEDYKKFEDNTYGFDYLTQEAMGTLIGSMNNNLNNNLQEDDFKDKTAFEIFGGLDVVKEELDILPLSIPNKLIKIHEKFAEIDSSDRDSIEFKLENNLDGSGSLSYKKTSVELYGKKITLSYKPSTKADEEIIKSYGDIFNTPAYLISVNPVLKVDGKIIEEGSPIVFGKDETFEITMNRVSIGTEKFNNTLYSGGYYAVGLDYGRISQSELEECKSKIEKAQNTIKSTGIYSDDVMGDLLNGLVKNYFSQVHGTSELVSKKYDIRSTRLLSFGMTGTSLKIKNIYGMPVDVKLSSIYIDIDNDASASISKRNNDKDKFKYVTQAGVLGSAYENTVIEEMTGIPSVSTIKIIALANEENIPVYVINSSNINEILPKLTVSNFIKNEIKNAVNEGKVVTIPEREIDYYDWHGTGYIVQDPVTGSAGYMISGGTAGGSVSTDFSTLDWGEVGLYFLAGLGVGILTGIAFSVIGAIGMFFFPQLAIVFAIIAIVSIIGLIYEIFSMISDYYNGDISIQDYYNKLAFIVGSLIGAFLGGKFSEATLIKKIRFKLFGEINKKYNNINENICNDIYENSGKNNYESTAKLVNKLLDQGLSEQQISSLLKNVSSENIPSFAEGVNKYFSETGNKSLSPKQMELLEGYANKGKTASELSNIAKSIEKWYDSDGNPKWPPNDGALGTPEPTTIKVGTRVDRYGYEGGNYVSPEGTPYSARALAPGTDLKPYNVYEVVKPIEVEAATIRPWFDEVGLGTQYKLPKSVAQLIKEGYLRKVGN